jgi:hypothetical protein
VGRACETHKGEQKCKKGFYRYVWKKTLIGRSRITFEDTIVNVDWGSRSRGYQPVESRPIAASPLCSSIQFRPSSPEALHVLRHALLVKDGITGKKWPVSLACDSDFHVNHRGFYMPQICDMGQEALLPLRRKSCCGFFRPRSWVPEASMLTTRPPKPLEDTIKMYRKCYGVGRALD